MPPQKSQAVPCSLTPTEIRRLGRNPEVCDQDRRTFLKWGALLASQAIGGGGALNLLTGQEARADDTFANVTRWVHSVCGYCSVGCGLHIGVDHHGMAVAVRGMPVTPPTPEGSASRAIEKVILSSLKVHSTPSGAQVFVGSLLKGNAPMTMELPIAVHQIKLSLSGYQDWETQIQLKEEGEMPLHVQLKPMIKKGTKDSRPIW